MVNVWDVPVQPASVGVTVIVATTGVVPELIAVKDAMLPLPLAPRPIDGVLFVQLKLAPAVPVNVTPVVAPLAQRVWSEGSFTKGGFGSTKVINVPLVLTQDPILT